MGLARPVHQVLHGEYADRGEDRMAAPCFEQADELIEAKGSVVGQDGRRILTVADEAAQELFVIRLSTQCRSGTGSR